MSPQIDADFHRRGGNNPDYWIGLSRLGFRFGTWGCYDCYCERMKAE